MKIHFNSGVYGHEDYEVMLPLVVLHLPSGPVIQQQPLYHCLPEDLQAILNVGMLFCVTNNQLYFVV